MPLIGIFTVGLLTSNSAFADEYSDSGKTTCYIFKNGKQVKKASCTYKATGEYTGNASSIEVSFKIQGDKKATVVGLGRYFGESSYSLNGKDATQVLRDKSTLKKATQAQINKAFSKGYGVEEFVACVTDAQKNEFCYADGGIGAY